MKWTRVEIFLCMIFQTNVHDKNTLGPTCNEFGYNEHPDITSRFLCSTRQSCIIIMRQYRPRPSPYHARPDLARSGWVGSLLWYPTPLPPPPPDMNRTGPTWTELGKDVSHLLNGTWTWMQNVLLSCTLHRVDAECVTFLHFTQGGCRTSYFPALYTWVGQDPPEQSLERMYPTSWMGPGHDIRSPPPHPFLPYERDHRHLWKH